MSTSATIDTNEGWTFAGKSRTSEFPTTTDPDNVSTELPTHNKPLPDWGMPRQLHPRRRCPP